MADEEKLMDHFLIKVNGTNLKTEVMDDLIEVTIETSLHLPDMFTISVHDEGVEWVNSDVFPLGKKVEIAAIPEDGGSSLPVFQGEITGVEPVFGEGTRATLLVRGYDRSHRLHRGTHSKAFLQMTDSDIARQIAQENQLKTQIEDTTEVYDHVLQFNQSHMDFLRERAQRIGYEFFVEDETLYFRPPAKNGEAIKLEWGLNLKSFSPRLTLVEQVDELIVKGWDPKTCQVIVGQAAKGKAEPKAGQEQSGGETASTAFKPARQVVVHEVVQSQAEAETVAQSFLDELSGAFIEAEGVCSGQPGLRAGKFVKLSSLGDRFNGTYLVTATTQTYLAGGGYTTQFTVNGRRTEGLYPLLEQAPHEIDRNKVFGPVIGVVTNNKDPEEWGRVKVKYPWLSDEVESHWLRLVAPGAGPERGFYALPEINDEVLIAFEHGNVNRPYVLGALWNGKSAPPLKNDKALGNGKVRQRTFKTRTGHTVSFVDDGDDAGVIIETTGQHRLTLSDEKKKVVLETKGGLILTMDDSGKEITLESVGNMNLKSGGNLSIEARGVLEMKGATFSLNADGMGEVKSSGNLSIQGTLVKIN